MVSALLQVFLNIISQVVELHCIEHTPPKKLIVILMSWRRSIYLPIDSEAIQKHSSHIHKWANASFWQRHIGKDLWEWNGGL